MRALLEHLHRATEGGDHHRHRTSLAGIVAGNLLLMVSYAFGWISLAELMWTYWLQSVAIGVFNYRRMMGLEQFTTDGLTSNDRPVPTTPEGKRSTARFFAMHYGLFHLVYLVFLSQNPPAADAWPWLTLAAVSLVAGEWNTHRRHRETDPTWAPNLGTLLFQPYLRVVPMHFAILAVNAAGAVLLPMKLLADVGMYLVDEHLDARRAALQQATGAVEAVAGPASPGVG
jgi:hypothetical protein